MIAPRSREEDEMLLKMLNMRDCRRMSAKRIAEVFPGVSKGMVCGRLFRIDVDTNLSDPDGNKNGSMPELWWMK